MTRQDRALVIGCAVVSLTAVASLSMKPMTHPAMAKPFTVATTPQNLQSARIHSLAGASAKAVSLF
jgi:hypothetical protein